MLYGDNISIDANVDYFEVNQVWVLNKRNIAISLAINSDLNN